MRDTRRVFAHLSAPAVADLAGRWDGVLVGRPTLRWLSVVLTVVGRMRGWCGKRVDASGDVRNRVRRHGVVGESVRVTAAGGRSRLDGRPATIVDHSTAKPPVSWVRGELRWLAPGTEVLGVLLFPIGRHRIGPFPFRLTRTEDAHDAHA